MNDYTDFIIMSEMISLEMDFNKLVTEVELKMIVNDKNMIHYTKDDCFREVCEMYHLVNALEDFRMKAIFHCLGEMVDRCEIYIIELEHQMNVLRYKYM